MTLDRLTSGESALVEELTIKGPLRQHLLDMGIIPDSEVKFLKAAPMGDPIEILTHGYVLTLRLEEARQIIIKPIVGNPEKEAVKMDLSPVGIKKADPNLGYNLSLHEHNSHPGYGEAGKYHSHENETILPKDTPLSIALVGQQNSGKSTLFNNLTGSNIRVGNFPGLTIESKTAQIKGHSNAFVTDLPGIYSLNTYTSEEELAKEFLTKEKPKAIINVVDASNIERNLYLTMQLMELEIPMVLALNMMDEVTSNGGSVRVNEMERLLGLPVVPISAAKGHGIEELLEHTLHVALYNEIPAKRDFCSKDDYGGAIHRALHSIMHLIEDHAEQAALPKRFASSRLVEGDGDIVERLNLTDAEKTAIEKVVSDMEKHRGLDRNAAMAEMRFSFIERLCNYTVIKPKETKERKFSSRIDKILTGKWSAIPSFIVIISIIFWLTFNVIGPALQDLVAGGIDILGQIVYTAFERWQISEPVVSLVMDAIFGGVGSVVSFVPIIIVLFFFLSMLEDSGYMARIAFMADKLLRKIGLSGRSIVPLLISFGCTVAGVMSTRTLPSAKDRKATILLTPFMSCSAKITIYGFFVNSLFPGHGGFIMVGLYLLGIFLGIITALIRKWSHKHYQATPFVMEMPVYRMPYTKNVLHLLGDKVKDFLHTAFTVILLSTIVIWFLQSFDFRLNYIADKSQSMLAAIAGSLVPIFEPVGLGDWRIITSLISGFLAKESVIATMDVLGVAGSITAATAIPMLIFSLLYTPCVASISSIRRELGRGWATYVVIFQCVLAWICAWIGYLLISPLL